MISSTHFSRLPITIGIYFGAELQPLHFQFITFVFKDKKVLQSSKTALEYIPCYAPNLLF